MSYSILCIDDDAAFLLSLKIQLKQHYRVYTAQSLVEGMEVLGKEAIDLVLLDVGLGEEDGIEGLEKIKAGRAGVDVVMISGHRDPRLIVSAIRAGASDYICKPFATQELVAVIEKMQNLKGLRDRHDALVADVNAQSLRSKIIGESDAMKDLLDRIACVKGHQANVLITGESGTGKELVARYLHNLEGQKNRPFIAVNCAAIPEMLIESELFGHERGAFTGASRQKVGKFELAHGGDIFLDEINSLKPELQAKILRVIQEQEVFRVGGTKPIKIRFRVIAAANVNLDVLVRRGEFRMDLYHRLRVLAFKIPPLRERPKDIPVLVDFFLKKHDAKKQVTPEVLKILTEYPWPGNVRELENLIHSLVIMVPGNVIEATDLPRWLTQKREVHMVARQVFDMAENLDEIVPLKQFIQLAEARYIHHVMEINDGDKSMAARILGISRSSLYEKIRNLH